jgi:acyl-CoA thioester hydrolase
MPATSPVLVTPMQVRTYECDYAQVVNNANYLKFFEQARHLYTLQYNIDSIELAKQGVVTVVAHADVKFIRSLKVNDTFVVHSRISQYTPVRAVFEQIIYHTDNPEQPITKGLTTIACVIDGRPSPFPKDIFANLFASVQVE